MPDAASQYDAEEFVRRGEELFEREIRARVAGEDPRKCLLIDIESGDFEVGANELAALERLISRHPEAQVYFRRVGSRVTCRLGSPRIHQYQE